MQAVEMDGELVMMGQQQGEYFSLKNVAASIWRHLECPVSAEELTALVAEEYAVPADRCRGDVAAFLDDLLAHRLAEAV